MQGEASRLCQANVLIKVVRTHLSDADRTCHKPWPSDAPAPEGERAAKNKTQQLQLFQNPSSPAAPRTPPVTGRAGTKEQQKEESSSTCFCYSNWEQPCFTVNGLSIFAAGSYGSWIYVPIAFCIYRFWPPAPAPAPAPVSSFSCLSVSPTRPSAL